MSKTVFSQEDVRTLKLLILKGIPNNKIRGEIWYISSGAKKEHKEHPNYYSFLLNDYPANITLPNEKQIDLDVVRTFQNDPFFRNEQIKQKLRRILLCYSKRNLSIGYVQGFNFIVGRLLKIIEDEEKIFWILVQIIEYILPINYFSEMAGVMIDVDILVCILEQIYECDLKNKMKEGSYMFIKNILFQWFLSLFVVNFNEEASLCVWDMLFIEGTIIMFKSAVTIIKLFHDEIISCTDLELLQTVIQNCFVNFNKINKLKSGIILKKFRFDDHLIQINRSEIEGTIVEKINKTNMNKLEKMLEKIKSRNDVCNVLWPFCLYECESYYTVIDYLVLKPSEKPEIIEDYFDDNFEHLEEDYEEDCEDISVNYQNALIERKRHVCGDKSSSTCSSVDIEKKKTDSLSQSESEDYFENDNIEKKQIKVNEHYERKSRYKKKRTNKCISSVDYVKENDFVHRNNDNTQTFIKKGPKLKTYEDFISKANYKYSLVSMTQNKNFHLLKNEPENIGRMSIVAIDTNFL